MTALIPILTSLASALLPLIPKLLTGQISLAEAKKAADEAVAKYQADSANLPLVEQADDSAADAAAAANR